MLTILGNALVMLVLLIGAIFWLDAQCNADPCGRPANEPYITCP